MIKIFISLSMLLIYTGCAQVAVGGISKGVLVAKEERTVGTFIDDTVIAARLKNLYFNNNEKIFFNVDVEVNEGRVLLTGTVETSDIRIEATKLAWGISDVVTVINEIQISDNDNILDYADDLVITTKINAKLLINKEINNLSDLSKLNESEENQVVQNEPKMDKLGRSYATGRRKESTARVWVKRGTGKIVINGKEMINYFARPVLQMQLNFVFDITERKDQFDVIATVKGGGLSGQAGAVRHGLSRALSLFEPDLRKSLKTAGMLTRDSRVVERKKYGRAKARKSFQFSKR